MPPKKWGPTKRTQKKIQHSWREGKIGKQSLRTSEKKDKTPKKSGMTCLEATVQFVSSHFRRGLPRLLFVASRGSEVKKRRCGVGGSPFKLDATWSLRKSIPLDEQPWYLAQKNPSQPVLRC